MYMQCRVYCMANMRCIVSLEQLQPTDTHHLCPHPEEQTLMLKAYLH